MNLNNSIYFMRKVVKGSINIIKEAGEELKELFYKCKEEDLGFSADKKMETRIIEALKKNFVDFQIISEEIENESIKKGYVWVLDPIDGTYNFENGLNDFTISLGLLKDFKPIFGIVYAPIHNIMYVGGSDFKSFIIDNKGIRNINVSNTLNGNKLGLVASPAYYFDYRQIKIRSVSEKVSYVGSASLRLCMVAKGDYDVNITLNQPVHLWDICASYVIVKGAGGHITSFEGEDIIKRPVKKLVKYNNFICSNITFFKNNKNKIKGLV